MWVNQRRTTKPFPDAVAIRDMLPDLSSLVCLTVLWDDAAVYSAEHGLPLYCLSDENGK